MTDSEIIDQIKALFQKYAFLNKDYLTLDEAAEYTGLTRRTVQQYASERKIPHYKPGKGHSAKIYFMKSDLNDYITKGGRIESGDEIASRAATYNFKKQAS